MLQLQSWRYDKTEVVICLTLSRSRLYLLLYCPMINCINSCDLGWYVKHIPLCQPFHLSFFISNTIHVTKRGKSAIKVSLERWCENFWKKEIKYILCIFILTLLYILLLMQLSILLLLLLIIVSYCPHNVSYILTLLIFPCVSVPFLM